MQKLFEVTFLLNVKAHSVCSSFLETVLENSTPEDMASGQTPEVRVDATETHGTAEDHIESNVQSSVSLPNSSNNSSNNSPVSYCCFGFSEILLLLHI